MREAFATLRTPQSAKESFEPPVSNKRLPQPLGGREPAMVGAPAFGMMAPGNSMRGQTPRGALNDNMPLAAYA